MDIHRDGPEGRPDNPAIDKAIMDIETAERDLEHAREEEAVEELERAKHAEHWVVVNGRRKEVQGERVTFEEAVKLAFPNPPTGDGIMFTVQFTRGPEHRPRAAWQHPPVFSRMDERTPSFSSRTPPKT